MLFFRTIWIRQLLNPLVRDHLAVALFLSGQSTTLTLPLRRTLWPGTIIRLRFLFLLLLNQ